MHPNNLIWDEQHFQSNRDINIDAKFTIIQSIKKDVNTKLIIEKKKKKKKERKKEDK